MNFANKISIILAILFSVFFAEYSFAENGEAQQQPVSPVKPTVPEPPEIPAVYQSPFQQNDISTAAPPLEQELPASKVFQSNTSLGGIMTSGNASTRSLMLDSETIYNLEQWAFILKLFAAYSASQTQGGETIENLKYYGLTLKEFWFWTRERTNYLFNQEGALSDVYEGYDVRVFAEGGYGRSWFGNRPDLTLRTEAGMNYTYDNFVELSEDGKETEKAVSGLIYSGLEYSLNDKFALGEDARLLLNIIERSDYRLEARSYIRTNLNSWLSFATILTAKYDSTPALIQQLDSQGVVITVDNKPVLIPAKKLDIMVSVALVISFSVSAEGKE